MNSETKSKLQDHLSAIAAILYEEADPADLTTLYGIEQSIRGLAQEHVLPELGIFLSTAPQTQVAANLES